MKHNDLDTAVYGPSSDAKAGNRRPIRLAGTGSTDEQVNLSPGSIYELRVGDEPVRIALHSEATTSPAVADTDMVIGAYQTYQWFAGVVRDQNGNVMYGSHILSVQAADGASAFEAHVYLRSR